MMLRLATLLALSLWLCAGAMAQLRVEVPAAAKAGEGVELRTHGSGQAELLVMGHGHALRRGVQLGETIHIGGNELFHAGRYSVVLRQNGQAAHAELVLQAAAPHSLSFLARPSRLPVNLRNGISGVVYPFDRFQNLVLGGPGENGEVNFELRHQQAAALTRRAPLRHGVAWVQLDSASREGAAEFAATLGEVRERRVVQQVAGEACSLRIQARRGERGILVETAPIRDCSGNPVPDGTIVTFISNHPEGVTTVDAPVKRGIAQVELAARPGATVSVASGVVMGNEIRLGGQR